MLLEIVFLSLRTHFYCLKFGRSNAKKLTVDYRLEQDLLWFPNGSCYVEIFVSIFVIELSTVFNVYYRL